MEKHLLEDINSLNKF